MIEEQTALGTEDYRALHAMQMSDDTTQRAQAATLAQKLTPDERKAFFDYQKTENAGKGERTREDNSLLGMPPELAVLSGLSIGRAIGAAGLTAAQRAIAGLKATGAQITPVLKYEAVKSGLQAIGVSPVLATAAATAVSMHKGKAGAASEIAPAGVETAQEALARKMAAPSETAAIAAPAVASAEAAPVPPGAQSSPQSGTPAPSPSVPAPGDPAGLRMGPDGLLVGRPGGNPDLPDQKALNEAALAARRQALQARQAAPAAMTPPASMKLSAAETKAFLDLRGRGMSGAEAIQSILQQRELIKRLGAPSAAEVQADMASRYRSGGKTLRGYDKQD